VFESKYWLPANVLEGGRPKVVEPDAPWVRIWKTQCLADCPVCPAAGGGHRGLRLPRKAHPPVHAQEQVAGQRLQVHRWAISIGLGRLWPAMAQPSITQVLTWFHSLLFQWTWSLFLSDPFIFLFWIFIIVTVFLFGRGPVLRLDVPVRFAAGGHLQDRQGVGLKRFQTQVPQKWHDRLKWLKYAVFFFLLTVSMFSMGLAESCPRSSRSRPPSWWVS
jgi:NosR/NirI family nitrous oxide reductase transcriptional regulator